MSELEARKTRQERQERRKLILTARERAGRNVWWRRRIRHFRRGLGNLILKALGPLLLRVFAWTWRTRQQGYENYEKLRKAEAGFLAAIWHGSMLPLVPYHRNHGLSVLVSPSADGTLIAPFLRRLNYSVIRGSSNRSGSKALRDMRDKLEHGSSVVITPDGPIGPIHSMNVGLAWLAKETGLPIMTAAVSCSKAWHAHSWDRFTIPKPGSRIVLTYGAAIHVAPDASDAELERITECIRTQLLADEARGLEMIGASSPGSSLSA
ncbi:MAG: lysophospholipid acyltransferase family protein [Planctomycetota bacterium]